MCVVHLDYKKKKASFQYDNLSRNKRQYTRPCNFLAILCPKGNSFPVIFIGVWG